MFKTMNARKCVAKLSLAKDTSAKTFAVMSRREQRILTMFTCAYQLVIKSLDADFILAMNFAISDSANHAVFIQENLSCVLVALPKLTLLSNVVRCNLLVEVLVRNI
jgi:hypothetical protein